MRPMHRRALRRPLHWPANSQNSGAHEVAKQAHSDDDAVVTDVLEAFVLRPWQRFHVRVTLLMGVVVFCILAAMGVAYYEVAYATEFDALQQRIHSTVMILSRRLDANKLAALDNESAKTSAYLLDVQSDLAAICRDDVEISSIYIFAKTDKPRVMRFIANVEDNGKSAENFGDPYPISDEVAQIKRGLREITIETEMTRDAFGLSLSGYAPLKLASGDTFGLVGVDILAGNIEAIRARVLGTTLAMFGAAALVMFLVAFILGRRIRGPIAEINVAAGKIAKGDFEHELAVHRKDEFGLMGHHFNTIAKSLKERDFLRDTFGRYVSPDIARRVLADRSAAALGGEEREVTVVFSDIEGYSSMTELIPPKEVLAMLNTYLAAMNEIIDQHQGCIIEFLGDAILTVFNAPNDVANHAEVGVRCALAMRTRLDEMNRIWETQPIAQIWRQAGKTSLRARIGIHSGRVVAGNLGSKTRMKYGLIGDVVNVAARIEALNKKLSTTLLVSADTKGMLGAELGALAVDRGEHEVKGRAGAVQVWGF